VEETATMTYQPSAVSSSGSGQQKQSGQREQFTLEELGVVLSRFDIGAIESVQEYARGSRKAPKLLLTSDLGRFLLKRRARGRDDPSKVAFTHAIQLHLANKQFPLPHLIGTRKDNSSMFHWRGAVYEVFEYIQGQSFPQNLEATFDGGHTLGLFHKLLLDFAGQFQPPTGSYHSAQMIEQGLQMLRTNILASSADGLKELGDYLASSYKAAAQAVEAEGLSRWPKRICHADWHPGNMLYRENRVIAVIDYDSARMLQPIIDIANGALQFAVIYGEDDVSNWPEYLDESRFRRYVRGYEEVTVLSQAELRVLPWLMIEALIAEAVLPIAATGTFGRVDGIPFLRMIERKLRWMQAHVDSLIEAAAS
jgi:Ser/Thr protein kinase RdoA (MazF antagonist)